MQERIGHLTEQGAGVHVDFADSQRRSVEFPVHRSLWAEIAVVEIAEAGNRAAEVDGEHRIIGTDVRLFVYAARRRLAPGDAGNQMQLIGSHALHRHAGGRDERHRSAGEITAQSDLGRGGVGRRELVLVAGAVFGDEAGTVAGAGAEQRIEEVARIECIVGGAELHAVVFRADDELAHRLGAEEMLPRRAGLEHLVLGTIGHICGKPVFVAPVPRAADAELRPHALGVVEADPLVEGAESHVADVHVPVCKRVDQVVQGLVQIGSLHLVHHGVDAGLDLGKRRGPDGFPIALVVVPGVGGDGGRSVSALKAERTHEVGIAVGDVAVDMEGHYLAGIAL